MIVAGDTPDEIAAGIQAVKGQIAFYGSTPSYKPVLELHGWSRLHEELNSIAARGEWDRMADAIDDEVLHTFAVVGTPEQAVAEIERRYGDIATRVAISIPEDRDVARWDALLASLRAAGPVRAPADAPPELSGA